MALEGTLRDFSLADIFQLIALQHKTGLLNVRSPSDTVTLGFVDGMLVSAESSAQRLDTRLGTVLVKTRRLRPEDLQRALEIQSQTLQRLGFILLKSGYCTGQDLRDGLDIQIRRIAYGLFRWTDGDYVFEQTDHVDYDHESTTPLGVEQVLMEGARMVDEWPIIEKVVRSLDLVYQRVPVAQPVIPADDEELVDDVEGSADRAGKEARLEPIRISRAEWAVYELVDGRRTVAEINEVTFLSEFDGCKAFFDLVSRGLIEEIGVPHRDPTAPVALPSAARRPVDITLFVGLGLALLGLVALHFQTQNPLNLVTIPRRPSAVLDDAVKTESLLRLRRVAEGVDVHGLLSGRFPDSLEPLVASHILRPEDLFDPSGNRYRYIVQGNKFYLVGFDREGKTDVDLLFSRALVLKAPEPQQSNQKGQKEAIEFK
ncbi:MAG: DUF4388 domain-containing protein [Thermoanaerobaculia bacterium]